mmetsp:Transcript_8213/g.14872  ORF Transcript_8213/g.14872 Transcript_8213/m.14872 type:complete len:143 (+) Transcript_8213:135-563(+)
MSEAGRGGRGKGGHVERGEPKEVINHVPEEVIKHAPVARGHHPDRTGAQPGGREHHGGRAGEHGRGPHSGRGRGRGSGRGSRNLLSTVLPADAGSAVTPFAGTAIIAGVALYAYKRAKKSKASRNDEAHKHAEEVELTEDLV